MLPKMSSSLNERMNFVTPRISDMLQNSMHVLYWSHSCFNRVPKLILDIYNSLGGETLITFRFRHSSNNNEASWAIHLPILCSSQCGRSKMPAIKVMTCFVLHHMQCN